MMIGSNQNKIVDNDKSGYCTTCFGTHGIVSAEIETLRVAHTLFIAENGDAITLQGYSGVNSGFRMRNDSKLGKKNDLEFKMDSVEAFVVQ